MPTPNEPGWYWHRTADMPEGDYVPAHFQGQPEGWEQVHERPPLVPLGEWGERIPDSDTLKARRELAARQPFTWDASGNVLCFFCQHPTPDACDLADPTTWAVPLYHAPDCPWLRAQEDHPRG